MTYGLDRGLFTENGPAIHAAKAAAARHFSRRRSWRTLEPERRLALIETAMKSPANDLADGLPAAL